MLPGFIQPSSKVVERLSSSYVVNKQRTRRPTVIRARYRTERFLASLYSRMKKRFA